jgi:myo-inositol-1(or 4)-monophosphatase
MSTPRQILKTLLPYLKTAATYARHIQAAIASQPAKTTSDNFFGAALSDADLSVQTFLEVALLAHFPQIRFYGEEYEKSYNTKYFRALDLGEQGDYLVTLDPIDGTQFYLDGHNNYQIILSILNADEFEAVIALTPSQNCYYYALRNEGIFQGTFATELDDCSLLTLNSPQPVVYLGWGMSHLGAKLKASYQILDLKQDYSCQVQVPNLNGILNGDLAGAVVRAGKWIDGAAIAFLAQTAGCIVTTLDGSPLPPLFECSNYQRPGLIFATSATVHQHLLEALQASA